MERTLSFEVTNHSNFSPFLKEILQGIFAERVYYLTYLKKMRRKYWSPNLFESNLNLASGMLKSLILRQMVFK